MPEIAHITYKQTGESVQADLMGMRPMQKKVYARRNEQYILLKSPPASGKSRAFMYIALDKLINQGVKKVIVAVPERTIGSSFKATNLTSAGFFADWKPSPEYNLCTSGSDQGKVAKFREFLKNPGATILICTHATLRFAYQELGDASAFNGCLIGIDEFHHNSADVESSRLGDLVKNTILYSTAHIMAMTGSYFRGDGVPVLEPEVEAKFTTVTFSYYDQLSGHKYLKAISLSYDFYSGTYFNTLRKDLDLTKKTIIHIPSVNSRESTKQKYGEVDEIIDIIGTLEEEEEDTGVYLIKTERGDILRVLDLVDDDPSKRTVRQKYLQEHAGEKDAVDIIIALNLAKEGFDWPPCEQMVTVGYRGSLTEIVQIIGRCTRDYEGKSEASFINVIAEPDAETPEVATAVNDLLKAVTASLLMEQVLLPKWNLKEKMPKFQILEPESDKAKEIINSELENLIADIMTNPEVIKTIPKKNAGKLINKGLIPKILIDKYPDLSDHDREAVRQEVVSNLVLNKAVQKEQEKNPDAGSDIRLLHFADGLILDIRDLNINMIDSINPFGDAYQILSKSIDKPTLGAIQDVIDKQKGRTPSFTEKELRIYWPQVRQFAEEYGRNPDRHSDDPYESRLGEVLYYLAMLKKQRKEASNAD